MTVPSCEKFILIQFQKRGKQRKQYGVEELSKAYHAVTEKKWSLRKAAREYKVPFATLHDRLSGRIEMQDKLPVGGPARLFDGEEERNLAEHFDHMSYLGYEYIQKDILIISNDYAVALNKKQLSSPCLSKVWYKRFRERFPYVKSKMFPTKLSAERANATSAGTVHIYYTNLKAILDSVENDPSSAYIIDEIALPMEQRAEDIYVKADSSNTGESKPFTLIGCANAAGSLVPPYLVLPGKRWNDSYLEGTCAGSDGECSEDGDTNALVFNNYFNNHFRKFVPFGKDKPIIVLYDGQKLNLMLTLKSFGEENNITFFVLPPHASCITGLNLDCLHPVAEVFNKESRLYCRKNNVLSVSNTDVGRLASKTYLKAMTPAELTLAFKRIGVYPFNSNIVRPSEAVLDDGIADFAGYLNQIEENGDIDEDED